MSVDDESLLPGLLGGYTNLYPPNMVAQSADAISYARLAFEMARGERF
jgi:hypothetical protein